MFYTGLPGMPWDCSCSTDPPVALERMRRPVHGPMFYTHFSKDDAGLSTRLATRNAMLTKSNKTAGIKIGS